MNDKLRELADEMEACWVCASIGEGEITLETINNWSGRLSAILDAEGDGGAVATVGQPPEREELISASLAIGGWLAAALDDPAVCAEMKRDVNRWFDAAMPSAQAHPARSGVVSDAGLVAMGRIIAQRAGEDWDNIGGFAQQIIIETQRAALEAYERNRK